MYKIQSSVLIVTNSDYWKYSAIAFFKKRLGIVSAGSVDDSSGNVDKKYIYKKKIGEKFTNDLLYTIHCS